MSVDVATADLLGTIVAATRRTVEIRRERHSPRHLAETVAVQPVRHGVFREAIRRPDRINVIAECKRRSPSHGMLRADYDPARIGRGYAAAGAAAISVLTEPAFFDGSLEHLAAVRAATNIPILRKDFIVDEYQLFEARAAGADSVLLIVAALEQRELPDLLGRANELGLDVVVEVHDAEELEQALNVGATIVGVNNRNLRTLQVDLHTSHELITRIPAGVIAVAESGLASADDLHGLRAEGYTAFLIGEAFMTSSDPADALRVLLAAANRGAPLPDAEA
jgi:indole-3-glycerol phosphate synthase